MFWGKREVKNCASSCPFRRIGFSKKIDTKNMHEVKNWALFVRGIGQGD